MYRNVAILLRLLLLSLSISRSNTNINKDGTYSTRSFNRRSSGTASESELSTSAAELLQDYMKKVWQSQSRHWIKSHNGHWVCSVKNGAIKSQLSHHQLTSISGFWLLIYTQRTQLFSLFLQLHTKLNADELRRFAQLLKAWQTNLPFADFCDRVLELYGHDRKYLLSG